MAIKFNPVQMRQFFKSGSGLLTFAGRMELEKARRQNNVELIQAFEQASEATKRAASQAQTGKIAEDVVKAKTITGTEAASPLLSEKVGKDLPALTELSARISGRQTQENISAIGRLISQLGFKDIIGGVGDIKTIGEDITTEEERKINLSDFRGSFVNQMSKLESQNLGQLETKLQNEKITSNPLDEVMKRINKNNNNNKGL